VARCLRDEEHEGRVYTSSPVALTEVNMDFKFHQFKIAVDDVSGSGVKIDFAIEYSFVWTDARMSTSPCRQVIGNMLSSKGSTESEFLGRYWRPKMGLGTQDESARRKDLLESAYSLNGSLATLKIREAVTIPQAFDYQFFPFDGHTIRIDLKVPSVKLYGCKKLVDQIRQLETTAAGAKLLPESGTWLWQNCGTAGGKCAADKIAQDIMIDPSFSDAQVGKTVAAQETCPILIKVQRSNIVFIVKHLMPLVVIAEAPLFALWLNPTIPPLIGARMTSAIIAMLLVMSKSAQDLGLGILTGIIWTDEFALVQFFMILSGLFETIFVATLIRMDKTVLALTIDGVFRKLLPFALYPCLVLGWIFKGLNNINLFFITTIGGMLLFTFLGVYGAHRNYMNTKKKRVRVINDLRNLKLGDKNGADLDDENTTKVMRAAFDTFDLDKSRKLEKREVRIILDAMYPNLTRKQAMKAMSAVQEDEIPFEDFAEAVETWNDIQQEPVPPRKRLTIWERLGFRKKLKTTIKDTMKAQKAVNAFMLPGKGGSGLAAAALKAKTSEASDTGAAGAFAGAFAAADRVAGSGDPVPPKLALAFGKAPKTETGDPVAAPTFGGFAGALKSLGGATDAKEPGTVSTTQAV
jgi:hypothetical protein